MAEPSWASYFGENRDELYQERPSLVSDDQLSGADWTSQSQLLNMPPSRRPRHVFDDVPMSLGQWNQATDRRRDPAVGAQPFLEPQADAGNDMLPDQDKPDEQQVWKEIQGIKAMPIAMKMKSERRNKLLNSQTFCVEGVQRIQLHSEKVWSRLKDAVADNITFELWHDSFRLIEGNFGTGVLSYFHYIKKVLYMNVAVFVAMLAFVVLPNLLLRRTETLECDNSNSATVISCCSHKYTEFVNNNKWGNVIKGFMDFLQGTGYMELTPLFYGFYENVVLVGSGSGLYYNLPLAYVLVSLCCLLLCLVFVVIHTAQGLRDATLSRSKFYRYCNVIFSAWDFCIDNLRAGEYKRKAVYNELRGYMETDQFEAECRSRNQLENVKLYAVRIVANVIVTLILVVYGAIIFFLVRYSLVHVAKETDGQNRVALLIAYQYLPAVTVSVMNILVTFFVYHIVKLERYSSRMNVILTLVRTVFLRVASIAVLIYSFFVEYKTQCEGTLAEFQCWQEGCPSQCWETVIGQTCYKLMLTDFACIAGLSLFVRFPLRVMTDCCQHPWMRTIFLQEFVIPHHVLDVVYNQTLCWLGVFYSPLLPGIAAIICFLFFYLKRFTCMHICQPPSLSVHTISSSAFYMLVSLFSFFAALLIVIFSLAEMRPSRSCGPFRGLDTMWTEVQLVVDALPGWLRSFISFFGSAWFAVPLVVVLLLAMFYYSATAAAEKHMIEVLKDQLVLEAHDKQFLLSKLNELTKRRRNVASDQMLEEFDSAKMGPHQRVAPQFTRRELQRPPVLRSLRRLAARACCWRP